MPITIEKSKLFPQSYLPLIQEARDKKINILGCRVAQTPYQSVPFFFKFPRYSDKSILNISEVVKAFGTQGYDAAKQAHESIWRVLAEGGEGNFIVNVDPYTVRLEGDRYIVANNKKSTLRNIFLKYSDSTLAVDCENFKASFCPNSGFVLTSDAEFDKSGKTSSVKSHELFVDACKNSWYSHCENLTAITSPSSSYSRVYSSTIEACPEFKGRNLNRFIAVKSKGASGENSKRITIDSSEGAAVTGSTNIDNLRLSPFVRVHKTHDIREIRELPKRQIIEGKVLPSGFLERIPLIGKSVPVLEKK